MVAAVRCPQLRLRRTLPSTSNGSGVAVIDFLCGAGTPVRLPLGAACTRAGVPAPHKQHYLAHVTAGKIRPAFVLAYRVGTFFPGTGVPDPDLPTRTREPDRASGRRR